MKHEAFFRKHKGRNLMVYPFEQMRVGDVCEVHPRDRTWHQLRSAMYQAAHKLGRAGHFKLRPEGKAMHVVDCINERTESQFAEHKRLNRERNARLRARIIADMLS